MKKRKFYIQLTAIALMVLLSVVLIICSDHFSNRNGEHGSSSAEPTRTFHPLIPSATSSPSPTPAPALEEPGIPSLVDVTGSNPHTSLFETIQFGKSITTTGIQYSNYIHGLPIVTHKSGTLSFQSDDRYTFTSLNGETVAYRMNEQVELSELFSGNAASSEADWFFIAALETSDYVYCQYDYWGDDELTLFIRISKDGKDCVLVYASVYKLPEIIGGFTVANEAIYYVHTTYHPTSGIVESSLMTANTDGSQSGIVFSFPTGYSAHHLTACDNYLLFFLDCPDGSTSLIRFNTQTRIPAYVEEDCTVSDYLLIHDHYAITGIQSSSLVVYDIFSGEAKNIALLTVLSTPKFGLPLSNGAGLYLQYFTWNSKTTDLLELHPETSSLGESRTLSNRFSLVSGITADYFYVENEGDYLTFPIN